MISQWYHTSWIVVWLNHLSDQIIATSHDLGHQKVAEEGKWNPLFQGNLGWWNNIPFGQNWLNRLFQTLPIEVSLEVLFHHHFLELGLRTTFSRLRMVKGWTHHPKGSLPPFWSKMVATFPRLPGVWYAKKKPHHFQPPAWARSHARLLGRKWISSAAGMRETGCRGNDWGQKLQNSSVFFRHHEMILYIYTGITYYFYFAGHPTSWCKCMVVLRIFAPKILLFVWVGVI